jgi:hypothetical protein
MFVKECEWNPIEFYSEDWKLGPPRGIMFHYTSSCSDTTSVFNTLVSRRASVHFVIDRKPKENKTIQYVDLSNRAWHANEASDYYYGIEHNAAPGNCALTVLQLQESARISSEIIKFVKQKWDVSIPIVRSPGCSFTPGFKQHSDGLGCDWNENGHTDGLNQIWTWPQYLSAVQMLVEDDDMALFANLSDFRKEVRKALGGWDSDGTPRLSTDDIKHGMEFINGINIRMNGGSMPEVSDTEKRNGWVFADRVLTESESASIPPGGKISGILTWDNS